MIAATSDREFLASNIDSTRTTVRRCCYPQAGRLKALGPRLWIWNKYESK